MYRIILHELGYLISLDDIHSKAQISKNTTKDWVRRSGVYKIKIDGECWINLSDIPKPSARRHNLPTVDDAKKLCKVTKEDGLINSIFKQLQFVYHYEFQKHLTYYASKYNLTPDKITHFARLHAVWEKLIEIQQGGGWSKAAQQAFDKLFPGRIETYNSFCNALHKAKKNGIEFVSVDGRLFREKGFTYFERVDYWIRYYLSNGKKYSKVRVYELAMAKCKEESIQRLPKLRCATRRMERLLKGNHDLYQSRYGDLEANKQAPYAKIIGAMHPLSQVQIDGFTLPFYYKKNGKLQKLIIVAVMDNHSEKILGYAFGESEDSKTIFAALENSFRKTEMLPAEIVGDNHTFHKTSEASHFKETLDSLGARWTVTSNPQYKAKLERKFKHINEHYFKNIPGWAGQGVKSRDKDGRPSQEYLDEYFKADNLHTPETIKLHVIKAIEEYNAAPLKKIGKSPNELFEQTEKKHAIPIDVFQRAKLFTKSITLKVRRGQINITRGGVTHEFQLTAELMQEYNNTEVNVRYDDLMDGIYIYTVDKDLSIGEVKPKVGIHGAIVDQDESDREKLLRNKGRVKGFVTKPRKANEALAHKDAVHDVNPLTTKKEIIQALQQDADLQREAREHGVNPDYYTEPGWNEERFTAASLKPKPKTEKKSPFEDKEHTIGMINLSEFDDK